MLFWIDSTAFTVASSNVLAGTIAEHDQILKFTSDCFAKSDCHCYRKDRNPKNQRHKKLAVISRRLSHARIEIQHTSILTHKYMATDKIQLKGPISRVSHARSILEASPDFRRRAGHLPLAGPPLVTRGRAAPPVSHTSQPPKSAHTSLRKVVRVFCLLSILVFRSFSQSICH